MLVETVVPVALTVVVGRGFSRRGFFLAGSWVWRLLRRRFVAAGGSTGIPVLLVATTRRELRRRVVEGGVAGGGRPTEISVEAVFVAASSVVVGRGSSRRDFFLAGIDNGAAIVCGGGVTYQDSERFAAFRRTVTVRFRFGPLFTYSTGMEASAWSVGFCISMRYSAVRRDFVVCLYTVSIYSFSKDDSMSSVEEKECGVSRSKNVESKEHWSSWNREPGRRSVAGWTEPAGCFCTRAS
jgi:hypothetical protein